MHENIGIAEIGFLVHALIERAPSWTMLRELVKNGIEAAELAQGDKIVHITSGEFQGYPKMVIWNTGPGMSDEELKRITDLSASIGKELHLDANFGVGAKVSSLANNKIGMRYRSCKEGRVSEVIIGYDEETESYVRFNRQLPDGRRTSVIDVTKTARNEGKDTSYDWTEVMLLGNTAEQDTVSQPFANGPAIGVQGVATALYRRFYRTPEDVKIRLDKEYHRFGGSSIFHPIAARADKFARVERVRSDDYGVSVHYLHDPRVGDRSGLSMSSRNALGSSATTMCLVHKDEMYNVVTGQAWSSVAPVFGIPFGAKELCVHIELDNGLARPSQYRERLISMDTRQDVTPEMFAPLVRELMPEWVKEVIRAASPHQQTDYHDLEKELQDLLDEFRVTVLGRTRDLSGAKSQEDDDAGDLFGAGAVRGGGASDRGGSRPQSKTLHELPEGATSTSSAEIYDKAPKIQELLNDEDIEVRIPRHPAIYSTQIRPVIP